MCSLTVSVFFITRILYQLEKTIAIFSCVLGSIVVSIPACHAGDRGSIPRRGGTFLNSKSFQKCTKTNPRHFGHYLNAVILEKETKLSRLN